MVIFALLVLSRSQAGPLAPSEEKSLTLADLDRVISQAKNLDAFLQDEQLQTSYFELLKLYYGVDSEESFRAILKQLKTLSERIPEIKARLWETEGMGTAFNIQTSVRTSGRKIVDKEWTEYMRNWREKLRLEQGP